MALGNIFKDIVTAVKGGVSEVGESIVDTQAIRILEQEIREAEDGIANAKNSLSKLKAQEIKLSRDLSELSTDIEDYTTKARGALENGNEPLARKIAEKIAELTASKSEIETHQQELEAQVNKIYHVIQQREKQIERNKTELQKAKTIEDLQKTKKAVAAAMPTNNSGAKRVQRAMDRVKKRQDDFDNQTDADQWMADMESGSNLDAEIAAAGLGGGKSSADDILASLKSSK